VRFSSADGLVGCVLSVTFESEEVEFTIEKEGWNVYELNDGTTLKIRSIAVKIFKTKAVPPAKGGGFGIAGQNVLVAKARPDKMGKPPSSPHTREEIDKAPKTKMSYTEREEVWNTYLLPDNTRVKVKLVVTSITKTEGLYDQFGDPIYVVNSDNIITSEPVT